MVKKIKSVLAVLLCAAFAVIPLSGVKESFGVQNVEKSAMVKSIGFDTEGENIISYVQSVIDDSSAFHTQGLISAAGCSFADAEKKKEAIQGPLSNLLRIFEPVKPQAARSSRVIRLPCS